MSSSKRLRRVATVALVMLLGAPAVPSRAAVLLTDDGTSNLRDNIDGTIGYKFTVGSSPLAVSALGIWDDGATDVASGTNGATNGTPDGLAESTHQIGIWNAANNSLVTSVTGAAVQSGSLIGEFRYAPTSATLLAGQTYLIGAYYINSTTDLWHNSTASPVPSSADASLQGYAYSQGAFIVPNQFGAGAPPLVGPNFSYTVVPEPAGAAVILALTAIPALGRRRR